MSSPAAPFVHAVRLRPWRIDEEGFRDYTDELPAFAAPARIELDPRVTFLVGENGSGKSTLVEAVAVASKLNAEGGGRVLLRPSGTEPALRVMVEGQDADLVAELADTLATLAEQRLN